MREDVADWLEGRKLDPDRVNRAFGLYYATKDRRPAIRYPTSIGVDRVRFVDGEHPKYKWWRRGGKPHWYGLKRAREILVTEPQPLWIVNGEPSVWAAWQSGVPAVCTCAGEGRYPSDGDFQKLLSLGCPIRIVFDADATGDRESEKLAQVFLELGAEELVEVRQWREMLESHPDLLEKDYEELRGFDVDDLHQIVGDDGLRDALDHLEIVPVERADKPSPRAASHWHLAGTVLKRVKFKKGPEIVWSEGSFWRYSDTKGAWDGVEDFEFDRETGSLDGVTISAGDKIKTLSVRSSTLDSVRKCAVVQSKKKGFFEEAPDGIQFKNGFLPADGDDLIDSSPELRQRVVMPAEYDPEATCPMWLDALRVMFEVDDDCEEKMALVQEFAGAILFRITGRVLFMVGDGSNGKSTVIDVLSSLVHPDARCTVPPSKMSDGHQAEYWIAKLAGKRLNVDADISARELLESSEFKKSVTGDQLAGRNPAGEPFEFTPQAVHVFGANGLPPTRDHSHGFWRRVIALKFNRQLDKDPNVQVVENLHEDIVNIELPGVVAWAVEGGRRLLSRGGSKGFTVPPSSKKTLKRWKTTSDQAALFIEQQCNTEADRWTSAKQLYKDYRSWAKESGHRPMSNTSFGRRMGRLGFTEDTGKKRRSERGMEYRVAVVSGVDY